jgi:hypothetical protein
MTISIEVKNVFVLESPLSTDLCDMRLKCKERNRLQLASILGFDVLTIFTTDSNAMTNVTKEIEVL